MNSGSKHQVFRAAKIPGDRKKKIILIDTHVHIYPCFNLDRFLNASFHNFSKQVCNAGENAIFVLCLSDTPKSIKFCDLISGNKIRAEKWKFHPLDEDVSILAESYQNKIIIVGGQQIVTKEKLEILSIGTKAIFNHGDSISNTVSDILTVRGLPVVPWGVGKWMGKRKKKLKLFLSQNSSSFLGDISGHLLPNICQPINQIAQYDNKPILYGTDPLPLSFHEKKSGNFGVFIDACLDFKSPWQDIRMMLYNPAFKKERFGVYENLFEILKNQMLLKIQNLY